MGAARWGVEGAVLEQLKRFFAGRRESPEYLRALFLNGRDEDAMLAALDRDLAAAEVAYGRLRDEAVAIEEEEAREASAAGGAAGAARRFALQRVLQLRQRREGLTREADIHHNTITLCANLVSRIQRMRAMRGKHVDERLVAEVVADFEQVFEHYEAAVDTDRASARHEPEVTTRAEADIARLAREQPAAAGEAPAGAASHRQATVSGGEAAREGPVVER
ncbi:MAG: hypothetical protein HY719_00655 [Planctomycetes bacterium]|nr:hypothetical protein [Planctomycetota bacterium]